MLTYEATQCLWQYYTEQAEQIAAANTWSLAEYDLYIAKYLRVVAPGSRPCRRCSACQKARLAA